MYKWQNNHDHNNYLMDKQDKKLQNVTLKT